MTVEYKVKINEGKILSFYRNIFAYVVDIYSHFVQKKDMESTRRVYKIIRIIEDELGMY